MKKIFLTILFVLAAHFCLAYSISTGDVLGITIVNFAEASGKYEVSPEGNITVPYAGKIEVLNTTTDQVASLVTAKLSRRVKDPEVYVSIEKATNNTVFITGMVKKPGPVKIEQHSNLATIVAEAGGVNLNANSTMMLESICFSIKSLDGTTLEVPNSEILESTYKPRNGDIIIADVKGKINVNIVGHVRTPGRYLLSESNNTIMSLIVLAGGLDEAADYSKINVYDLNGGIKSYDISGILSGNTETADIKLADNTTIIIPELKTGITTIGWFNSIGKQLYQANEVVRLSDVYAKAGGGVKGQSRIAQIWVLREVDGQVTRTPYDFNAYQKYGDITGNPILKNGDVVFLPYTEKIQWLQVFSAFSSFINFRNNILSL